MKTERKIDRPTLATLEARMRELGEVPCGAHEDDQVVQVFSARSVRGAHGQAAVALQWNAAGGWYTERTDRVGA